MLQMLLLILLNLPKVDSVALAGRFAHDLLRSQEVPVARLVLLHGEVLCRVDAGMLTYPSFHRLYEALSEAALVHDIEIFLSCRVVGLTTHRGSGQVFDFNTLMDGLFDLLLIC